jgi:hypothetical protein
MHAVQHKSGHASERERENEKKKATKECEQHEEKDKLYVCL